MKTNPNIVKSEASIIGRIVQILPPSESETDYSFIFRSPNGIRCHIKIDADKDKAEPNILLLDDFEMTTITRETLIDLICIRHKDKAEPNILLLNDFEMTTITRETLIDLICIRHLGVIDLLQSMNDRLVMIKVDIYRNRSGGKEIRYVFNELIIKCFTSAPITDRSLTILLFRPVSEWESDGQRRYAMSYLDFSVLIYHRPTHKTGQVTVTIYKPLDSQFKEISDTFSITTIPELQDAILGMLAANNIKFEFPVPIDTWVQITESE